MRGLRRFLEGVGLATLATALGSVVGTVPVLAAASKAVSAGGRLYRTDGTSVYVSTDDGATWLLHTDFTSVYSLKGLAADRSGGLKATLGYQGRSFGLALARDQQAWLTT